MKKSLPKVFVNVQNKKILNNKELFYSRCESKIINNLIIENKINHILNSKDFFIKANVIINLNNNLNSVTIVGRTKDNLLTIENNTIPIKDIIDIKKE